MEEQKENTICEKEGHDFSVIITKQKSLFAEVTTKVGCKKCGLVKSTGMVLFDD